MRAFAVLVSLLFALPAFAQPGGGLAPVAPPPDASESPEYKQAVAQALEEYRLGHFEEARSLFERAHGIDANARTLRGLGMVEFELRHYVRASALLGESLSSSKKPLTDEQRKSVEQLLERSRQFIANYAVTVDPPRKDVMVELDGKPIELGKEGHLSLEAGEHVLRISGPELSSRELKLDVKGGEQQTLRIELEVKEPKRELAAAPAPAPEPVVTHPYRKVGIGLTAGGGAALLAGGILGGLALGKAGDADTKNGGDADSAKGLALGSDIALGVGIAGVAVGVVLIVLRGKHSESRVDTNAGNLRVRF